MRDYKIELKERVTFIRECVKEAKASGIVFGNSGGKDSALVGILCKLACPDTLAVQMPCGSKSNFNEDLKDALELCESFCIENKTIDLTKVKGLYKRLLAKDFKLTKDADTNIAPRLRMTALYAIGRSKNMLVAGTGNRSETHIGYFTKWGDGAYDFNPIGDLTVSEVYEFLRYLKAPENIINKAPSGGLFDGQTDEAEIGLTYNEIDNYILNGVAEPFVKEKIDRMNAVSEHKRVLPKIYKKQDKTK